MGANTTSASGTKAPAINMRPQMISVPFKNGKKYPEAIKPVVKVSRFSGRPGGKANLLTNEKTPDANKIRPKKTRAMIGSHFFITRGSPRLTNLLSQILCLAYFEEKTNRKSKLVAELNFIKK